MGFRYARVRDEQGECSHVQSCPAPDAFCCLVKLSMAHDVLRHSPRKTMHVCPGLKIFVAGAGLPQSCGVRHVCPAPGPVSESSLASQNGLILRRHTSRRCDCATSLSLIRTRRPLSSTQGLGNKRLQRHNHTATIGYTEAIFSPT